MIANHERNVVASKLKLMYITNDDDVAIVAEKAGIDRIWIDLETIGKEERQKKLDTVKSHHTVDDIRRIAPLLSKSDMLVRVDMWNEGSVSQIDQVIEVGAQTVMLPYWKTPDEVKKFISSVNGRVKTMLLLETKEAVDCLDEILEIDGVDEIHIGLNDLHLSYGLDFMFELYTNGVVEDVVGKIRDKHIPFGIGGIGRFDAGLLPRPEDVIVEQHRLGSSGVILSRSFCDYKKIVNINLIEEILISGVSRIREIERECEKLSNDMLIDNKHRLDEDTMTAVNKIRKIKSYQ